jgi:hypothetical protein
MRLFSLLAATLVAAITIGCNNSLERTPTLDADGAIRVARANGEVGSWLKGHSGSEVVKQVNGEWMLLAPVPFDDVNRSAGWVKSNYEFADAVRLVEPQANAIRIGDGEIWRVIFFSWLGSAPRILEVDVDGHVGKVITVAYRGPSIP